MRRRTRQRLVGALALVVLAVVFLPELLENPKYYTKSLTVTGIPPSPMVEPLITPPLLPTFNNQPFVVPLSQLKADNANPSVVAAATITPTQPSLTAWAVEVASFTTQKRAERLQNDLRKNGFAAFIEAGKISGRAVQLVKVGPELEQSKAKEIVINLKKILRLNGQVVRHPAPFNN